MNPNVLSAPGVKIDAGKGVPAENWKAPPKAPVAETTQPAPAKVETTTAPNTPNTTETVTTPPVLTAEENIDFLVQKEIIKLFEEKGSDAKIDEPAIRERVTKSYNSIQSKLPQSDSPQIDIKPGSGDGASLTDSAAGIDQLRVAAMQQTIAALGGELDPATAYPDVIKKLKEANAASKGPQLTDSEIAGLAHSALEQAKQIQLERQTIDQIKSETNKQWGVAVSEAVKAYETKPWDENETGITQREQTKRRSMNEAAKRWQVILKAKNEGKQRIEGEVKKALQAELQNKTMTPEEQEQWKSEYELKHKEQLDEVRDNEEARWYTYDDKSDEIQLLDGNDPPNKNPDIPVFKRYEYVSGILDATEDLGIKGNAEAQNAHGFLKDQLNFKNDGFVARTKEQIEFENQIRPVIDFTLDYIYHIYPHLGKDPFIRGENNQPIGLNDAIVKELQGNPETTRVANLIIAAGHYLELQTTEAKGGINATQTREQRYTMAALIHHDLLQMKEGQIPKELTGKFAELKNEKGNDKLTGRYSNFMKKIKLHYFGNENAKIADERIMPLLFLAGYAEVRGLRLDERTRELPESLKKILNTMGAEAGDSGLMQQIMKEGFIGNTLYQELGLDVSSMKDKMGKYVQNVATEISDRHGENDANIIDVLKKFINGIMSKEGLIKIMNEKNLALLYGAGGFAVLIAMLAPSVTEEGTETSGNGGGGH